MDRAEDDWQCCDLGHAHWGLRGAAGLLVRDRIGHVLLTLRSPQTHMGGTWSVPGGALSAGEGAPAGALREAREEIGLDGKLVKAGRRHVRRCGGWEYTTVLASVRGPERPALVLGRRPREVEEVRWVAPDDVAALPLHPGFGASWPQLRRLLPAPRLG